MNPSYYGLADASTESLKGFCTRLVDDTLRDLIGVECVSVDGKSIEPQVLGRVASYYYLHHTTVYLFDARIRSEMDMQDILVLLCDAREFSEVPVRHNEDGLNEELAQRVRWPPRAGFDSPHVKTLLLLQAHFDGLELPIVDYVTDLKSVLGQAIRILQALVDISANTGFLHTTLRCMYLSQMIIQGRWHDDCPLLTLPHVNARVVSALKRGGLDSLASCVCAAAETVKCSLATAGLGPGEMKRTLAGLGKLPLLDVSAVVKAADDGDLQLNVCLIRRKGSTEVQTRRFPKTKNDGWWVVVGCEDSSELLALKRCSFGRNTTVSVKFEAVDAPSVVSLYIMSDCYIGLDSMFDIEC